MPVVQRAELDLAELRLAVGADDVDELLRLVGADRAVGDEHGLVGRRVFHAQPRRQAGSELALGVVEAGAQADRAGLRVEAVVDEVEPALVREALLVGEGHAHGRRLAARGRRLEAQVGLLAAVEVGVDLAHAGDRGQHRLLVDEIADRDVGARRAPGDRRAHRRVLEIEPGDAQRRLGAEHVGLRGARSGSPLVDLLARHGLRVEQLLGAHQFALRELQLRLVRRQRRLRTRDLGLERARIDREHQVALLDEGAVDEVDLVDGAGDARPQLDVLGRFETAAELLALGDGALHRRRDADRRRARRPALRVGAVAAGAQQGHGDDDRGRREGDRSRR
jgi:hypothetical protein